MNTQTASTLNVALDNDHRMFGHDDILPDCPRCQADAEELGMSALLPPARHSTDAMVEQIGRMTILATSGGRVFVDRENERITLPVSNGYRVVVQYDAGPDTYTVRRLFVRAGKVSDKGTVSGIYADQLDEMVYRAGCFRNVEFGR